MTLCNLSIEGGARMGMVAPDATTAAWLDGRPYAPRGADRDRALAALSRGLEKQPESRLLKDVQKRVANKKKIDVRQLPQAWYQYFPEDMAPATYYHPVPRGLEIRIGEKLERLRRLDREARGQSGKESPASPED